jgi:hypothetical protein
MSTRERSVCQRRRTAVCSPFTSPRARLPVRSSDSTYGSWNGTASSVSVDSPGARSKVHESTPEAKPDGSVTAGADGTRPACSHVAASASSNAVAPNSSGGVSATTALSRFTRTTPLS